MKDYVNSLFSEEVGKSTTLIKAIDACKESKVVLQRKAVVVQKATPRYSSGTKCKILKTYSGGSKSIMQSKKPAVLIQFKGKNGKIYNRIVDDSFLSPMLIAG